jgi:hypothetical protein
LGSFRFVSIVREKESDDSMWWNCMNCQVPYSSSVVGMGPKVLEDAGQVSSLQKLFLKKDNEPEPNIVVQHESKEIQSS